MGSPLYHTVIQIFIFRDMVIEKLLIRNYKIFNSLEIDFSDGVNIFVGANDAGKTTLLEALAIVTTGRINGIAFDQKQLRLSTFNKKASEVFCNALKLGMPAEPPKIIIEAYFKDTEGIAVYKGSNNELKSDRAGVRVCVEFDKVYSTTFLGLVKKGEMKTIPIEFYKVSFNYFSGDPVVQRHSPFKVVSIDTTRHDYSYVLNQFVSNSIDALLSSEELKVLAATFRRHKSEFSNEKAIQELNVKLQSSVSVDNQKVSVDMTEGHQEEWKRQLSLIIGEDSYDGLGFGTQNAVRVELALKRSDNEVTTVLMEEPENNLAYRRLTVLLGIVQASEKRQIFVSTHSSYVANSLGLKKVIFVSGDHIKTFGALDDDTQDYFKKLPNYDTLRFVLSDKAVLVEGPTDFLVLSRAYRDRMGREMSSSGYDVISVGSLSFARYCEIAKLTGQRILALMDNDGDKKVNVDDRYCNYISSGVIEIFTDTNDSNNTIEPSVLAVNCVQGQPTNDFREAISAKYRQSMINKSKGEILQFMSNNKAEWAYRVLNSDKSIKYPDHVIQLVDKMH